jgi:hypothetical protein
MVADHTIAGEGILECLQNGGAGVPRIDDLETTVEQIEIDHAHAGSSHGDDAAAVAGVRV